MIKFIMWKTVDKSSEVEIKNRKEGGGGKGITD